MRRKITKQYIKELSYEIIGAAIEVHKILGPGLLENTYEKALIRELDIRGLKTTSQQSVEIFYKGMKLREDLRYDVLVDDLIVIENKAVVELHPVYFATLMSYMHHLKKPKGILFNFNVQNIVQEGMKTFVNEYFEPLPAY